MKFSPFLYFLATLIFISCDRPYEIDVVQAPQKIIIEGLVTDRPSKQMVKVSRSGGFNDTGATPRVTDAVVTVTDDLGNTFTFVHNPGNSTDSAGVYIPDEAFAGDIGRTYTLTVIVDGQSYSATERLESVIPVDSITFRENPFAVLNPEVEGRFYELLMYAREPQDQDNFYFFNFYRNDSLKRVNNNDIYYSDDELLAENINGVPGPILYSKNDVAKIEVLSISRKAFVFYNDLQTLLNGDAGGMFGPVPSSPRTNLSNGALGFFQVSAVSDAEAVVD